MEFDSLVAPKDRVPGNMVRVSKPPLTDEEVREAMDVKNKKLMFPQIDRQYADPAMMNQKICLFSFVPSKGAKPDEDGFYGMAKVRGVFATEDEANERAEHLIRNVDSYHQIFHAYVGRPFPVTNSDGYEQELQKIDIRKKTVKLISEDILSKKKKEEEEMRDMQEKEKKLLEQSKRAKEDIPEDPYDVYITNQVKRAQLIWTYQETMKKCQEMKGLIQTVNQEITEQETAHPQYKDQYKQKYMDARKEAGIPEDQITEDSFLKFLGMDLIPELE